MRDFAMVSQTVQSCDQVRVGGVPMPEMIMSTTGDSGETVERNGGVRVARTVATSLTSPWTMCRRSSSVDCETLLDSIREVSLDGVRATARRLDV